MYALNMYMWVYVWIFSYILILGLHCFCSIASVVSNFFAAQTWHTSSSVMGFSRQEYWSGLLFPSPGDLLDLGIELESLESPALQADSFAIEPPYIYLNC